MMRNKYTRLKSVKSWVNIYQVAIELFKTDGYHNTSIRKITNEAMCSLGTFYRYFSSKEEVIYALYEEISADLESALLELPDGTINDRFKWLLHKKLDLIQPYKALFKSIIGLLIDSEGKVGISGEETEIIRIKNATIFKVLIVDSIDCPRNNQEILELTNVLYGIHLGKLFLWLLDENKSLTNTEDFIDSVSEFMPLSKNNSVLEMYSSGSQSKIFNSILNLNTSEDIDKKANDILNILFKYRKTAHVNCVTDPCNLCKVVHLDKIINFVRKQEPIHFILPAFPAKSPNRNKVLGSRPDLGEEIALQGLQQICDQIESIYKPGAKISICADGRVFTDLVKITDEDVSLYIAELHKMIIDNQLNQLKLYNLEDFLDTEGDFDGAREKLLMVYAKDINYYKSVIKADNAYSRLFNGIHRFITEDQKEMYSEWSNTKFKKHTKEIAIQVIQRSEAWGRFISKFFPSAIRLSIHPHSPHSEKIGIKLTKAKDNWITPWHGVILLDSKEGYQLVKRSDAIESGAQLIFKNNQPYYYSNTHE